MSAAAASKAAPDAAPKEDPQAAVAPSGKKKLIFLIAGVLVFALAAGGGAYYYLVKKRAAAAAEATAEGAEPAPAAAAPTEEKPVRADVKHAPTFAPLDPFTVNLADRDAERYAQVGMTLELADHKATDLLKAYMPAIRNNILLVLASKTAGELMDHEGKVKLAAEVRAAALKPLGYTVKANERSEAPAGDAKDAGHGSDEDEPPIRAVHFSNFIIQ